MEPTHTQVTLDKTLKRTMSESKKRSKIPTKPALWSKTRVALADITPKTFSNRNQITPEASDRNLSIKNSTSLVESSPILPDIYKIPEKQCRRRASGKPLRNISSYLSKHCKPSIVDVSTLSATHKPDDSSTLLQKEIDASDPPSNPKRVRSIVNKNQEAAPSTARSSRLPQATLRPTPMSASSQPQLQSSPLSYMKVQPVLVPKDSGSQSTRVRTTRKLSYKKERLRGSHSTTSSDLILGVPESSGSTLNEESSSNHTWSESESLSHVVISNQSSSSTQPDSIVFPERTQTTSKSTIDRLWETVRAELAQRQLLTSATYASMSSSTGMPTNINMIQFSEFTSFDGPTTPQVLAKELGVPEPTDDSLFTYQSSDEITDLAHEANLCLATLQRYSVMISTPDPKTLSAKPGYLSKLDQKHDPQSHSNEKSVFPPVKDLRFVLSQDENGRWLFGLTLQGSFSNQRVMISGVVPEQLSNTFGLCAPFLYGQCTTSYDIYTASEQQRWNKDLKSLLRRWMNHAHEQLSVQLRMHRKLRDNAEKLQIASNFRQFAYLFAGCEVQIWEARIVTSDSSSSKAIARSALSSSLHSMAIVPRPRPGPKSAPAQVKAWRPASLHFKNQPGSSDKAPGMQQSNILSKSLV